MDGAVLFADVAGSTALYEVLGDQRAFALVQGCLGAMGRSSTTCGGRVVKTIGDAVMAVFPGADAAVAAAISMQLEVGRLGPSAGVDLGVRVGFRAGSMVERDGDVFGDTVNLASRLCDLASRGQIVTDRDTAMRLSPMFRPALRQLYSVPVKGKEAEVELVEVLWQAGDADRTAIVSAPIAAAAVPAVLKLSLDGTLVEMGPDRRKVRLGRDADADFSVRSPLVSRAHATIERRRERFVLSDHSANGTYVVIDGRPEIRVHHEDLVLSGEGAISLGQPNDPAQPCVHFRCSAG